MQSQLCYRRSFVLVIILCVDVQHDADSGYRLAHNTNNMKYYTSHNA